MTEIGFETHVRQRADDVLALDIRHAANLVEALQRVRRLLLSLRPVWQNKEGRASKTGVATVCPFS